MTLREKQSLFAKLVSIFIIEVYDLGYEVTFGEAWRSETEARRLARVGKGIINSLHRDRLAIDLNLFKDGKYLTRTESYKEIGELWESYSTEWYTCAWGGRFGDGNHFSLKHGSRS